MKSIRYLFILLFCFIYLQGLAQDYWEQMNPPGGLSMFDIAVDSEGRIYLACPWPSGALTGIYRSDDNFESWARKIDGMTATAPHPRSIAIDDFDNIIVGGNSRIYRSGNHGEEWMEVFNALPNGIGFNTNEFGFDSIFLLGGQYGYGIVRSGDHGISWQVVLDLTIIPPDFPETINGVAYADDGKIYACSQTYIGGSGSVYVSEDYGMSWSVFYNNGSSQFTSIEYDPSGRLLVGANGVHYYDFDTGTWEYHNYNFLAQDILVVPENKIFIADPYNGGGFGVVFSGDNGQTYEILNSGMIYPDATDFTFDLSGRILVCGDSWNSLWRSYDTLITAISPDKIKADGIEFSAYPNPFTTQCIIQSSIPEFATLTLFNSYGETVLKAFIDSYRTFKINGNTLPQGMYLAVIESHNYKHTIKLFHH